MKRILSILICFCIISSGIPLNISAANDYSYMYNYMESRTEDRESIQSLAQAIYTRLDETCFDEVLENGKQAYNQGEYEEALEFYRNYFIEKMRKANAAYYPNYTPSNNSLMLLADVVCGKKTVEDYLIQYPTHTWVDDCLNAFGSPYVEREIDWLGGIGKEGGSGYWGKGQEAFLSWIGMMGAAYYKSGGDKIYLDKFFEVAGDFSVNHYNDIKEYEMSSTDIPVRDRDTRTWQWPGLHGNNERFSFLSCSLIQLCKLLPAEGETGIPTLSSWDDIVLPFGKANPEYYDLIDPVKLAQFTVCSIEEIINMLSSCYQADIASNQRNSGARSCVKALAMFSEFTHLSDVSESCSAYMASPRFFYEDGTFLEQSFNYNDDEARSNKGVIDFYRSINENEQEWFSLILEYNNRYYKFREAFLSNALLLPKIGNGGDSPELSKIWENDSVLETYKNSIDYTKDITPPGFKSVYFPWGGYACLRSGWDIKNDMTLQTYNSETSGTGHKSLIRNGIWLTAYGRPLIVSGEGSLYGESYLPESQRSEYDKWVEYFGESASRKGSTVMVNDDNQADVPTGESVRTTTEGAPIIDARYHDSDYFDYIEGKYVNGYIDSETGEQYDTVSHLRQSFFIEEAGFWIINDLMENIVSAKETEYSQIWRFPTYSTELGHNGFTNDEVVIDEENYLIKTQDVGSVNLFMKQFSNEELKYQKYFGSKGDEDRDGVYRGWTANGIQGPRVASPDVYVRWNDLENNGLTSVMTLAMPSKTESTPYSSVDSLNNSDKGITGFRLETKDNVTVISLFAENGGTVLEASGIKAKAKNLVITEKNGVIRGVLLDCSELYYNNAAENDVAGSFEFIAEDGEFTVLNIIDTPYDFEWDEADGKEFPVYSQTDKLVLDGINNIASDKLADWIKNNKSLFNLYRERELIYENQLDFISEKLSEQLPFTSVSQLKEAIYVADKEWLEENASSVSILVTPEGCGTVAGIPEEKVKEGEAVALTAIPNSGYKFVKWEVVNGAADIVNITSTNATFKMPAENVTINAVFAKKQTSGGSSGGGSSSVKKNNSEEKELKETDTQKDNVPVWENPFTDVAADDWFYADVEFAVNNGLFKGITENEFLPEGIITRGMMVAVLYRNEKEPATNKSIPFGDVDMSSYYASAVSWAKQNGIINGVLETEFAPDDHITREQIAAIMFRYAQYKGMNTMATEENLHFDDSDMVSEYAVSAIKWAVGTGLMRGRAETTLNPKDNATRAEIAAVLHRFIEENK